MPLPLEKSRPSSKIGEPLWLVPTAIIVSETTKFVTLIDDAEPIIENVPVTNKSPHISIFPYVFGILLLFILSYYYYFYIR